MSSCSEIEKSDCSPGRTGRAPKQRKLEERNWRNETTRPKIFSRNDYTVGWISALPLELAAAQAMLDESHGDAGKLEMDNNTYTFGTMAGHNCVIACLPAGVYGHTSATTVASQMRSSFPSISFWLLVGIGGGAPTDKADIRLGDVVSPGVIQYDYGKMIGDGIFERTGILNKPPTLLLTAVSKLQGQHRTEGCSRMLSLIDEMMSKYPQMSPRYGPQDSGSDVLFKADYDHQEEDSCQKCNRSFAVTRPARQSCAPVVHYGTIASANQVMRHAAVRDRFARDLGILCFEMESAGLLDNFPCLTIRGICDYADSHKNKEWQEPAAATAAAYAKELLGVVSPTSLRELQTHRLPKSVLEHRELCLKALDFDRRGQRGFAIKDAFSETCTWLLGRPEFQKWLDSRLLHEHNGFLWIKGNPGTGKSTLMKFAFENTKQKTLDSGAIVISFFFNARGDELEKSTTGMYRSLLFQLFNGLPRLQKILDSEISPSMLNSGSWCLELLQYVFRLVIRNMAGQPLICFIDALDECEESEVRDMVDYFGELSELAVSGLVTLHVCLSSRHYPHVTFDKGLEMIMEGQNGHGQDITRYLDRKLANIKHREIAEVKTEIIEKASGIFLWVVMVVDILKRAYDQGRMSALRKRLREIPPRLKELFKDILTRDKQNMEDLLLCLQCTLYANRPLSPGELFYAVQSHKEDELDLMEPLADDGSVCRFILSSSKGLVEVTEESQETVRITFQSILSQEPVQETVHKTIHKTAQFIHESVRDFLLNEGGLNELWWDTRGSRMLPGHEVLKVCCWNYLTKAYLFKESRLPDDIPPQWRGHETAALRQNTSKSLPFLHYAVNNVLQHAEAAEQAGVSQTDFLSYFDTYQWTYMHNLFETGRFGRYAERTRLTYILADKNLSHLLKATLEASSLHAIFNNWDCRYCGSCLHMARHARGNTQRWASPFLAAMARRNQQVVRVLLTIRCTSYATQKEDLADLFSRPSGLELMKERRSIGYDPTIFEYAMTTRDLPLLRLVLSTGRVDLSTARVRGKKPVMFAVETGDCPLLMTMLDFGADPNEHDMWTLDSPLGVAVTLKQADIVQLLLERGADPSQSEVCHRLPSLHEAVMIDPRVINQLLFARANMNVHVAACRECVPCMRWLFQEWVDMNPNSHDSGGSTSLHYASSLELCDLLIDGGADLNVRDNEGRTPIFSLDYAKVQLLLRRGAQVNIKDNNGYTPLMWVAGLECSRPQLIQLLLDNGANPDECTDLADSVDAIDPGTV
ncbi:uncharacterized protein Aud_005277 [Aspergillus udagawae]|uniref:Nucleoside phosphorylase domain-containing protein n=1 Tax=Aspergillus udagawae TaxID=91492 RepID=A0A8E0QQZ8_9EURO|nr:uncharacterized protein Aud_005277 [Aspergillus udagawae]GIC88875.1 hypothetical protein Aud_005277 [Aspergillus udagawae]